MQKSLHVTFKMLFLNVKIQSVLGLYLLFVLIFRTQISYFLTYLYSGNAELGMQMGAKLFFASIYIVLISLFLSFLLMTFLYYRSINELDVVVDENNQLSSLQREEQQKNEQLALWRDTINSMQKDWQQFAFWMQMEKEAALKLHVDDQQILANRFTDWEKASWGVQQFLLDTLSAQTKYEQEALGTWEEKHKEMLKSLDLNLAQLLQMGHWQKEHDYRTQMILLKHQLQDGAIVEENNLFTSLQDMTQKNMQMIDEMKEILHKMGEQLQQLTLRELPRPIYQQEERSKREVTTKISQLLLQGEQLSGQWQRERENGEKVEAARSVQVQKIYDFLLRLGGHLEVLRPRSLGVDKSDESDSAVVQEDILAEISGQNRLSYQTTGDFRNSLLVEATR